VLRPVREAKDDPTWRPTGFMEGLAYQARVSKILRERFIAQRHFCHLNRNPPRLIAPEFISP
jgi:hypothetical protein